jgi:uncharacterized protein
LLRGWRVEVAPATCTGDQLVVNTNGKAFVEKGAAMGMKENAEVVRNGYEAFGKGDMDTIRANATDDIVWKVPGKNPTSGDKVGIEATLAYFVQLFELTGGTVKVELHDLAVGTDHVIAQQRNAGEINGKRFAFDSVMVFSFRGDKISQCEEYENDQHGVDAVFS